MSDDFNPTEHQTTIICHGPSAFISACPGAGKTRVMVERAKVILGDQARGRGIAFLSFTNAAVSELEARLRNESLLGATPFPHFIGTFDSFLWQFLVAPFGFDGCETAPRLIPDKESRTISPFIGARAVPLKVFDHTGAIIEARAREKGFAPTATLAKAYATAAVKTRAEALKRGELDFDDARNVALVRCNDPALSVRLKLALAARFRELIVDEAQDCNPADLEIIKWLRDAKIPTKLICDPHQSIYEFRGGVTQQLFVVKDTFEHQLSMQGNFRSTPNICKAITALRPHDARTSPDEALGKNKDEPTPIYVLSYPAGQAVPPSIGLKVAELAAELGVNILNCPILAATRSSGAKAIGQPAELKSEHAVIRLANAVMDFHFSFAGGDRRSALESLHRVVLSVEGHLVGQPYHQYLADSGLKAGDWRPRILAVARALRYDPAIYVDSAAWHASAKQLLAPGLVGDGGSIAQRLKSNLKLPSVLAVAPTNSCPAKTIHSVKGLEFDGVCVVMTKQTAKRIIDFLETGAKPEHAEEAREIYVAASRAKRLLAIAVPSSQAARLVAHLATTGTTVESLTL